ncbi:hypothetical protein [Cellvibrio sp. UBA7661]|uniref:hypothetical protein n=1 Tax=Cellvibrio sp. UBA7661 TaxID=1946311 RepID=UPI002F35C9AF
MDKVAARIEENRNLIQATSATVASMGLDKVGQKVAGVMVTPAAWLFNYTFLNAKPDAMDIGIYATGFVSAGASTTVGLLKSHVDDSMLKSLLKSSGASLLSWLHILKTVITIVLPLRQ